MPPAVLPCQRTRGVIKEVITKEILPLPMFFKIWLQARLSPRQVGEESPDSKEQCTGEEPGVPMKIGITDSATENNCPDLSG